MTIRNYFLNDFVAISFDNPLQLQITNENNEIQTVSFDEKVVNQNDGSTRFFVYFIPRSNLTALVCKEMILNYKNSIERAEQIETIPGRQGDLNIGKHRSIYSKRIYFYTESDISSSDLLILEKIAGENDLYLTFRNSKYLKTKMDIEKPQAFISHDSRDKEEIARKLAYGLSSRLCTVWYDEYSLKIGDSLRDSIEKGIKEAKKCILVLTPNFLNNLGWTKKEFDSIFTRELIYNQRIILPIWHNVSKEQIYEFSPALADTVALKWPNKEDFDEENYKKEVEILISKIHTAINN
ncbi:toll/interleukin-1 receptor domain-containing protein [Cloacibacterium normanense]|jgi:hypothetical protein|uniref:toll/interleukin-1 receptor domain-containing protein n=1 Tax=Cloacibacterium normanense TaxID=237258 RepID=UPI0035AE5ED1